MCREFMELKKIYRDDIQSLKNDRDIKRACHTNHLERRMESLLDLVADAK
jgi:hypothetical protein